MKMARHAPENRKVEKTLAKRKSPKTATKAKPTSGSATDDIVDAVAVDVTETSQDAPEADVIPDTAPDSDASPTDDAGQDRDNDGAPVDAETTDIAADTAIDAETTADESPEPEPENTVQPAPTHVQPEPERASILPMIFAGILTAVLGFFAARSDLLPASLRAPMPEAVAAELADITDRLATLETTVATLSESQSSAPASNVDQDQITAQIGDLSEQITAITPLTERVNELTARVDGLTPQLDSGASAAVAELRETATAQQAEIDKLLADARLIHTDAAAEANATLARAAVTRIVSAVDTGTPFAAAIGDLKDAGQTDISDALTAVAADGVLPLATLQDTYPDAARGALAAARSTGENSSGLSGFLQRQLGARSVAPREGSDPDAVLSRIEAAVRAGRLGDALAEADQLPDPARDSMATWLEQAQTRYDAVTAANALAQRLSAL